MISVKCVVIGDGIVGKTSLLNAYTSDDIPARYTPTVFDSHSVNIIIEGRPIHLSLWDTSGQEAYESLLPLIYPDTSVFLVCFSLINPSSLENVWLKWYPEVRRFSDAPVILVGTKLDLRDHGRTTKQLSKCGLAPVKNSDGLKMKQKIGAVKYIECSSLTRKGIDTVFVGAAKAVLYKKSKRNREICTIL